jgi:hypothetical protein
MIATSEDQTNKEEYWINELMSLAIEPRRKNEFNDKEELEALAIAIKEVYFQDYKTAYNGNSSKREIIDKESHFIIWAAELVK